MTNEQIAKLRGHAENLLDLFIALREKYALLHPIAFDRGIAERVGAEPAARGHRILQDNLLQSCVLDIAKLTLDEDSRTPSVINLMKTLEDEGVRRALLHDYASPPTITHVGTDDPLPAALIERLRADEARRLTAEFEERWADLEARWTELKSQDSLHGFKAWRDKLIAHSELRHDDGRYKLADLSALDLKWGDVGELTRQLQGVVDGINLVARSAGFSWDTLDEQLDEAARGFWDLLGSSPDEGAV